MNFEEKKQHIKKWLKIPTRRRKIWSRNRKEKKLRRRRNVVKKSQSESKTFRRDRRLERCSSPQSALVQVRRFLKHVSCRCFFNDADNSWHRNACPRDISRTVLWVFAADFLDSEPYCPPIVNVFIRAGISLSAAALTSLHCDCVSEHLEKLVNATSRSSFVRKFFPQLFRIISFQLNQNLIFVAENHVYKQCNNKWLPN